MRLRYLARARDHLADIFEFIEQDDPEAARRVIERIRTSAENLQVFPFMGRPGVVPETFEYVVPGLPYIIVYKVRLEQAEEVLILGVFHGAQNRE